MSADITNFRLFSIACSILLDTKLYRYTLTSTLPHPGPVPRRRNKPTPQCVQEKFGSQDVFRKVMPLFRYGHSCCDPFQMMWFQAANILHVDRVEDENKAREARSSSTTSSSGEPSCCGLTAKAGEPIMKSSGCNNIVR